MSTTFQFLLLLLLAGIARADDANKSVTDGPHSCGGVDIPYPFGIRDGSGNGDYRDDRFGVACDAGKPVLPVPVIGGDGKSIPIGNFSIDTAEARVWLPVSWQCYNSSNRYNGSGSFPNTNREFRVDGAYRISNDKNNFFVLGCATYGLLRSKPLPAVDENNNTIYAQLAGCISYCDDFNSVVRGRCSGVGCCHTDIPPDLLDNYVYFSSSDFYRNAKMVSFSPCDYAFLAEKHYYNFRTADLNMDLHQTPRLMPVTVDWAIRDSPTCELALKEKAYACRSNDSRCLNSPNGSGYICKCKVGYEGNPYIPNGCTDINECEPGRHYPCQGDCKNKQGSYDCTCPKHTHSVNPFNETCNPSFPRKAKIITGSFGSLLFVAIMVLLLLLSIEKRKRQEDYKKNGGPALEKVNNIKIYRKGDIRKIQKSSNIIGRGGFGMVYKGCIGNNNQLVAVKVPINVNSSHNDQFQNEISIQSRVIHKNIVKLIGCCLEVGVPILVYEFVPKGSLDDILHGDNSMPLTIGQRLQIAAESAEGLSYMHSKTTTRILHGDVKPANILLNDDLIPKISDFGISRLIVTNKEHTGHVIGDMSYMDPVFLQTGLLTNKSDVYSFGVVLLELITRKKASHSDKNRLVLNFIEAYKKDKSITDLVDKELVEIDPQLLDSLTGMISECLHIDVDQRPDMTDLEERLHDMVKRFPNILL